MRHLSLRIKLTLAFLLLALLVGTVNFYQIQSLHSVNSQFKDIVEQDAIRLQALNRIKQYGLEAGYVILQPQGNSSQSIAALQEFKNKINNEKTAYSKNGGEDDALSIDSITTKADAVIDTGVAIFQPSQPVGQLPVLRQQFTSDQKDLLNLTDQSLSNLQQQLEAKRQAVIESVDKINLIAMLATGLIVCTAILLGIVLAVRITASLNRVRTGAQRIANGNFSESISISSGDEIGLLAETFNQMSSRLRDSYSRLAIEKQRDETILQNMGEGLIAVDKKANIVLINNVAIDMLDLEEITAIIGKELYPLFDLYKQDKKKTVLNKKHHPVFEVLQEGKPITNIFTFHKKENRSIMISFNTNPIIVDDEIVGAIIVLRDVTHEREVDRMKTEFISLASHQLRTPLSAIKWFSEMLLSGDAGKLTDEQADFTKNITDSTQRMIELVNSLLNISRIESGRIMIDPKPTDLKELVNGIVTDLKAKTEERQQDLIVSVHSDLPKIKLDPRLIGQVYLNLLTNAIKYTPKGGEISVFISKKDDQVVSQVTDNGYGIPKEQQTRIFQKFFRAENVAKVETDGTGLGLYLIKAIVESSGGKIWFESEENKGTTFWFSIPLSGMKAKEGEVTLDG